MATNPDVWSAGNKWSRIDAIKQREVLLSKPVDHDRVENALKRYVDRRLVGTDTDGKLDVKFGLDTRSIPEVATAKWLADRSAKARARSPNEQIQEIKGQEKDTKDYCTWSEGIDEYDPPLKLVGGRMQQDGDDLTLDEHATWMGFLESFPKGNATMMFRRRGGEMESIRDLDTETIAERCPLLSLGFEDSRSGPRMFLELATEETIQPFLRFVYTGNYALGNSPRDLFDVPTSVLLHCQLYHLGEVFELEGLKSAAYVGVLQQCEFGCSSPDKPIDLCAAIRYCYKHLDQQPHVIDSIINYCVSCFLSHRLGKDVEFQRLSYDLREFHQALCNCVCTRSFMDDTASAIIQMPFKPYVPETYASREDVVYSYPCYDVTTSPKRKWTCAEDDIPALPIDHAETAGTSCAGSAGDSATDDSASEDEGLRIVRRRLDEVAEQSSSTRDFLVQSDHDKFGDFTVSDDDYERVLGPDAVKSESSEIDSDCETVVGLKRTMPIRQRSDAMPTKKDDHDSDADDWTLV
ncbi:Hypothetical protein R9X50_00217300 [Acrodontium crateriforme]|uniref:Uncharacterized protein n=1 Tax=Acrodontium crateriforme TaxID=150365 RepID=A0AAQ3M202_9PEZI|nr:Hypothetical protein R9X50_00217300 [Acrodontium crateriforme]